MAGENIWKPNRPWAKFAGGNRPILVPLLSFPLPSASVCFRHLPSASVSVRFWSACLIVTWMSHDADIGRSYLETQHALGQIFGEHRPILVLFITFLRFRPLPSASVSFRFPLSTSISGRIWSVCLMETCLGARMMTSGEHIWKPNRPWGEFAGAIGRF